MTIKILIAVCVCLAVGGSVLSIELSSKDSVPDIDLTGAEISSGAENGHLDQVLMDNQLLSSQIDDVMDTYVPDLQIPPPPPPQMNNYNTYSYSMGGFQQLDGDIRDWKDIEDTIKEPLEKPAKGSQAQSRLKETLHFGGDLEYEPIVQSDSTQKQRMLVSLEKLESDIAALTNQKADVVCVIDVSGSMQGQKLDNVKKTLRSLLDFIKGSRISIVTFSSNAEVLMNFKIVNEENIPKIGKIIDYLHDQGSTNILDAVKVSQKLLKGRSTKNQVASMLLLSDGQHNSGPISNDLMFTGDYEAAGTEYTLHTFGYGDDHDASLMQSMAERKHGNYYFVNDISKVDECFADCLGMVSSTLANNALLTLKLQQPKGLSNVKISRVFGSHWALTSPTEAVLDIGIIYEGFNKQYGLEIEFDSGSNVPQRGSKAILATLALQFVETGYTESTAVENSVSANIYSRDSKVEKTVNLKAKKELMRAMGADEIRKASELNFKGQNDVAITILKQAKADFEKEEDMKGDPIISSMIKQFDEMITMLDNEIKGIGNVYKASSYIAQVSNVYGNQMSAPQYDDVSSEVYQNSKQKKNVAEMKSRKGSA